VLTFLSVTRSLKDTVFHRYSPGTIIGHFIGGAAYWGDQQVPGPVIATDE
jgi:hypothetical protein